MVPLTAELEALRREFERLANDATTLAGTLTDDQFNWQPAPRGWSIGQCIEHLNAAARAYLPALDDGVAAAIGRGLYGDGPFRYSWLGRLIVAAVEPPARPRLRAPRAFRPPSWRPRQDSLAAFRAYQIQYIDRLRQANGLDLARAHVRSPGLTWLPIPLGSGFAAMAAHERRHLWQARRVAEAPTFPR